MNKIQNGADLYILGAVMHHIEHTKDNRKKVNNIAKWINSGKAFDYAPDQEMQSVFDYLYEKHKEAFEGTTT